jgi:hypothetical protein
MLLNEKKKANKRDSELEEIIPYNCSCMFREMSANACLQVQNDWFWEQI